MQILWFIPTSGDGRRLAHTASARVLSQRYLGQIAQAADTLGYHGVLLPTGRNCQDPWVAAAALLPATERLRFLVAIRPGLQSPTAAARMAATFDQLSEGRLLINVVTGGDPVEARGDGLFLDHDERYRLTDEFLTIWRLLMAGETVTFAGRHLRVDGASLAFPPLQPGGPPLYFGGSSEIGQKIAAERVDHYLTWGEPPAAVADKIAQMKRLAAARGRTLSYGIRLHVIVRDSEGEAWEAAADLIRHVDAAAIAKAQQTFARFDSVGQQRMVRLHHGKRDALEISPNLWAGIGLVRGGAGTALVGNPSTVAARLREYAALGIDSFILSGYPHLEEAYRVAELVFPLLPELQQQRPRGLRGAESPFGAFVGEQPAPARRVGA